MTILQLVGAFALVAQFHLPSVTFPAGPVRGPIGPSEPVVSPRPPAPGSLAPRVIAIAPREQAGGGVILAAPEGGRAARSASLVCGMTVVATDPSFDSKMRIHVPEAPRFTIRSVKPPICASSTGTRSPTPER
jgi:hypothetical protein